MTQALKPKDLMVKPITAKVANAFVVANHYSGKVVPNSQVHLGVFHGKTLCGAMQFGPSINKKGSINLVRGTGWNSFIELNRMVFANHLPKNSESRCIGVAMRMLKKRYPHLEWVISFADATQCGDGAIYRASGFVLTDIRHNDSLRRNPATGEVMHIIQAHHKMLSSEFRRWPALAGYQLRYIYFLDKAKEKNLAAQKIPFTRIAELGVGMYCGKKKMRVEPDSKASGFQSEESGAEPTNTLHISVIGSVNG
jgi:hypothetical protein